MVSMDNSVSFIAHVKQRLKPGQSGVYDGDAASTAAGSISVTMAGVLGRFVRGDDFVTARPVANAQYLHGHSSQAENGDNLPMRSLHLVFSAT